MTTANVQIKKILVGRGNATISSNYAGVRGEVTMNTTTKALHVHDGVTTGGWPLATEFYVANLLSTYGGVPGPQGPQGNIGVQGVQGNVGPQGLQGIQGNVGPQGIQGNVGAQGPQGIQGIIGATGATGPQGIQGNVGATGSTGAQGSQGIQGNVGPQGIQGNVGATGSQGPQGATGATGATGPQGIQGNVGATGSQGIQGNIGPQGSQGIQGIQGNTGAQGVSVTLRGNVAAPANLPPTGTAGDGYIVNTTGNLWFWNSTTSSWGDIGPIVGPEGPQGPQGIQGNTGAQGSQGIQGNIGPQGPQGIQGNIGPQGPQGIQGIQGNVGATGPQGIQGNIGATGSQGPQGIQGNTGAQGPQGIQGNVGATGSQGPQGIQGNVGPQGIQGNVGAQGPQGIQGNIGPQGIQGNVGPQGPQGAAGSSANTGDFTFTHSNLATTTGANIRITTNGNTFVLGSTGNLFLPNNMSFTSSPAMSTTGIVFGDGSFQRTAYTQATTSVLVSDNGVHTVILDGTGNLTVPGSILPNSDNVFDLGSSLYRFRHLYVGPGTVYIGNAAIKSTVSGNLILPGVTRAVASTAFVEQIQDTGDQSYSFATNPTIIDNAHFAFLDGNADNLSFTPATYSSSGIDNDGYIRNITIDTAGSGYSDQVADLAEQDMWATEAADPINNFVAGDWTQIPFRAGTRAGESEYDFDAGGNANTGNFTFNEDTITNSDGMKLTTNRGTLAMGTNMEGLGVAQHFHIAFDGSNSNPPASDLFLGDDYNYVKLPGYELNPGAQYGVEIGTKQRSGPQNIVVDSVDELVPPGGVWRLFIIIEDYPNLGSNISIGAPVTPVWGAQISATITDIVEADGDWQIHVDQDITAGFSAGPKTVSFGTSGDSYTWRFGTDGILTFPSGMTMGTIEGSEVILASANTQAGVISQGISGASVLQWVDDLSPTSVAVVAVNSLFAANTGAVQILTGNAGPTPEHMWTFDADGNLTVPGPIQSSTGVLAFQANIDRPDLVWTINGGDEGDFSVSSLLAPQGDDQHIGEIIFSGNAGGGALVYVGNVGTPFDNAFNLIAQGENTNVKISTGNGDWQWTFGNTGQLTLPTGGLISGYPGGLGGSWFVTPEGDSGGGISSQDGQQYIQVNDDLFIEIGAGYGTANAFVWQFGLDGTFATSGNISTTGNVNASRFNFANGVNILSTVTGGGGNVDLGKIRFIADVGTTLLVTTDDADGYGGYNIAIAPDLESPAFILVPNNANATLGDALTIGSVNANSSVQISTDAGTWIFGNTGTLTVPGTIDFTSSTAAITNVDTVTVLDHIQSPAYQFANGMNILSKSTIVGNVGGDADNGTLWFNTEDGRTYVRAGGYWIDANPTVVAPPSFYTGNLEIAGSSIISDTKAWTFGTDGNLTLPPGSAFYGTYFDVNYAVLSSEGYGTIAEISNNGLTIEAISVMPNNIEPTALFNTPILQGEKKMFSIRVDRLANNLNGWNGIGIGTHGMNIEQYLGSDNTYSVGFYEQGDYYGNQRSLANPAGYTTGDIIDVAVDNDGFNIWMRVNGGNWNNNASADPAANAYGYETGEYGTVYPGVTPTNQGFGDPGNKFTLLTTPTYSVPAGFEFYGAPSYNSTYIKFGDNDLTIDSTGNLLVNGNLVTGSGGSSGTDRGVIYTAPDIGGLVFANVAGPGYGSLTVLDAVMKATTTSGFTATVTGRNRLVLTNGDSTLSAGNDIYLTANLETGAQSWRFGANGSLGLPQLGQVTNNGQLWNFRNDGVLVTPSGIYVPSGDSSLGLTFSSDRTSSMGRISVDNSNNMTVNSTSDYSVKVSSNDRVYISNNTTTVMAGQDLVLKSNKNATEQVWTFGANGNVTIAGNINFANGKNILSSISSIGNITFSGSDITGTGSNVTLTADTTDYVFYANGTSVFPGNITGANLALPAGGRINFDYLSISSDANVSAFYAPAGNVQLAAGIGNAQIVANSLSDSKTWTFDADGRTTFPSTAVPVHSYGAVGDKAGMMVLDADYIYYCKSDFVGHTSAIAVNSDQWNNATGEYTSLPFLSTARAPQVGWTISINFNSGSTTLTITGVTSLGNDRYQVDFNSVGALNVSNGNSGTLIDSTPVADIWVRTVWTDTNW